MQKYENKEVSGNEYDKQFSSDYILITKKIYYLNGLIFSKYPLQVDSDSQKNKMRSLTSYLSTMRTEIESSFKSELEKGGQDNATARQKMHYAAVRGLIRLIDETKKKLS